jgi:hypothetical protein
LLEPYHLSTAISEQKTQKLVTFMDFFHKNPLYEFELDFFFFLFVASDKKIHQEYFYKKGNLGACLHLYMKGMH